MRKALFFILIIFIFLIAGCGQKPVAMDVLNEQGVYNYRNQDLGFQINLPPEFIYYQTQRKDGSDYTDLEIFVPTSDRDYPQEIPSYARPLLIRVYTPETWQELEKIENEEGVIKLEESKDKVYAIKLWNEVPDDWQDKWSEDMQNQIIESFSLY